MHKHPALALFILPLLTAIASAQTHPSTLFPKGTFDLQLTAAATKDLTRGNSFLQTGTVGLGYYFVDNVSLSAEISGFTIQQEGFAYAGSTNLMLRQHFFTHGPMTLFADVGSGLFESNRNVPAGGTHFNFLFRTGLGATWRIADHTDLIVGLHYFHLSNARIKGYDRNPSINGIEGYMGVMWTF